MTTYPVNVIVSQDTPPSGGAAGRLWLRPTEWNVGAIGEDGVSQGYLLYKYEGGTSTVDIGTNTNTDTSIALLAMIGITPINDPDHADSYFELYRIPGWTIVGIAVGSQSVFLKED